MWPTRCVCRLVEFDGVCAETPDANMHMHVVYNEHITHSILHGGARYIHRTHWERDKAKRTTRPIHVTLSIWVVRACVSICLYCVMSLCVSVYVCVCTRTRTLMHVCMYIVIAIACGNGTNRVPSTYLSSFCAHWTRDHQTQMRALFSARACICVSVLLAHGLFGKRLDLSAYTIFHNHIHTHTRIHKYMQSTYCLAMSTLLFQCLPVTAHVLNALLRYFCPTTERAYNIFQLSAILPLLRIHPPGG